MVRMWVWLLLTGATTSVLLPSLHAAPASKKAAKNSTFRVALFALSGNATGQALTPGSAAVRQARKAGQKSQGRSTLLAPASFATLRKVNKGTAVQLPLAKGESVAGTVTHVQTDKGVLRVSGSLTNGQKGSFTLSQSNGQVGGLIQLTSKGLAYRIDNAGTVLREVLLSDIICHPFPRPGNRGSKQASNQFLRSGSLPVAVSPVAAVPILDSRASAVSQIYLDFDGETVTDPLWNDGNTINAASFNLSDSDINDIFVRVKEDFWPFDINVTTDVAKFNAAPVGRRMRCIITPTDTAAPGAGGVAYMNSFSEAGTGPYSSDIPCWVFVGDAVYSSEAVSHEIGHTLGLGHDGRELPGDVHEEYFEGHGTGAISWCSIMGASYYVSVSQWSRGQYQYANNQEDDLAIISNAANGFGYLADEAGNSLGTAAILGLSGDNINQSGVISSASDEDFYSFSTGGGAVTVQVDGSEVPNLDISLQLLDNGGGIVAESNPADALEASLSTSLVAGDYYVRIVGSNAGNTATSGYSTYASIGAYTLTGAINNVTSGPPNDNFVNAESISGDSGTLSGTPTTTNANATSESGEPDLGGSSVWYAWTAPQSGNWQINTIGSDYDTTMGVYTGSSVDALTEITMNDDLPGGGVGVESLVTFLAAEGTTYYIAVDGYLGGTGHITLNWAGVPPPNDDFVNAEIINGSSGTLSGTPAATNVNATGEPGEPSHNNNGVSASVWYAWTAADNGNLQINTIGSDFDTIIGVYTGNSVDALTLVAHNDDIGDNIGGPSMLSFAATAGATYYIAVDGYFADSGAINLNWSSQQLSISDTTLTEGNSGTTNATFMVSLSSPSSSTITVHYQTANGTAVQPADYTAQSGTLTFAPGDLTKTITVPVAGDVLDEDNERFYVNLSDAVNAGLSDAQGVGTINDNDLLPVLSINDVSVTETNGGSTQGQFTVTLSPVSGRTVTVVAQSSSNAGSPAATATTDYTALPATTLTFSPGQTSKTVSVTILGDLMDENDERLAVNLSGAVQATISDNSGVCTILDNDRAPSINASAPALVEGNSGTKLMAFTISLSSVSARNISVQYKTANAASFAATAGADYVALPLTTLNFLAGETTKTVNVTFKGDTLDEENEHIALALSTPVNAGIGTLNEGIIQDDDGAPRLSINDISVLESNGGSTQAAFTLALSAASSRVITVSATTATGGSPAATGDADYSTLAPTKITFNPGQTSKTVNVTVLGDTLDESDEKFLVNLSGATNTTLADNSGTCTILDNDAAPTVSVSSPGVTEGNSGSKTMTFTLKLSAASARNISVQYQTANAATFPASSGADYNAVPLTTVIFLAGQTTKTVNVTVNADVLDEDNERIALSLTSLVNATLGTISDGIIVDDDATPALTVNDQTIIEGNSGTKQMTFTITLSVVSGRTVTVTAQTGSGGSPVATAGTDYVALAPTTITFAPGQTTKQVSVVLKGDTTVESNERLALLLTSAANATLSDNSGIGWILNDDASGAVAEPAATNAPSGDDASK